MDSCNVMRVSKSGLETRIRTKHAPYHIDIDGDVCIHNACKRFSKAFEQHLEELFTSIYNDFKWSTDLHQYLERLCNILGVKFTVPERYVPTRWLSVYDVVVDTLRLLDVYTIFYFPFLSLPDRQHFFHLCKGIYLSKEIGDKAVRAIKVIQDRLEKRK